MSDSPRHALLLTAYDRPHYLERVLASWAVARGLKDWHLRFALEPCERLPEVEALVRPSSAPPDCSMRRWS